MNSKSQIIRDGAVAGILGAATVALWFLLFDFSRGRLFETPALLATTLFHASAQVPILRLVVEYSAVHVFAFVSFGVASAVLLEAAERNRSVLPSLLIVLAAFECVFVIFVTLLRPEFQPALSWWSVLVGNLLATAVMAGFFFARHPQLGAQLFGAWVAVLAEGAAVGVIGGTVVIIWFLFHDLGSRSNPFRTPAMIGGALLEGAHNPAAAAVSSPLVMGYTVLHFAAFVAFGVVAASLAASLDEPLLWTSFLLVFCLFQTFFAGFASVLSEALLDQLGWGTIVVGNLLSATSMLGFFYLRRSALHLHSKSSAQVPRTASEEVRL